MNSPTPYLPLATFGIVQHEFGALARLSRDVAEAVLAELDGVEPEEAMTPPGYADLEFRIDELTYALDDAKDPEEQEEIREDLMMAELELDRMDAGIAWGHDTSKQAGIVRALLLQYEGVESTVLSIVSGEA